jgi:hypothetical protein
MYNKTTKAGNFYWFTSSQRGFDDLEHALDRVGNIVFRDVRFLADSGDYIISAFVIDLLGLAMQ